MDFKKLTEHSLLLIPKKPAKHIIEDGLKTFPIYLGKKHSIKEVVNSDGTVNIKKAKKIMEDVASYFGGKKMQDRAENPVWHKTDPNTWLHTKQTAQNAWQIPVPEGYSKQDLMVAALGHDFGKILSGDGHAEVSYNLIKLVFPDATEKLLNAIRKHMDDIGTHLDKLEIATKFADIGVTPTADLLERSLTPELIKMVKETKWFKEGGDFKLIPKHEFGKILHNINPIEAFKKRAIAKGADKAYIDSIKKFNLKTESGRQAAAEYIAHLDGLLGKEAEEAISLYKNFFKEESKNMREGASVDGAPIIHSQSRGTRYNTQLLDSHEMYHNLITRCLEPIPEAAISKKDLIDTDPRAIDPDYYINDNNNEVAARISLVLSAHGITDARKITGSELKQMFDNYLKTDYLINDGIDFVASKVKNWDSLAKWANNPKNVYIIPALGITAAGILALTSLNNQALFSKLGGNMKLIQKAEGGRKLLTKIFNDVFKGKSLKELSPQEWDAAYNYVLLKYGNKESNLLQKIRDYHFYTAAPDTVVRDASGKPLQVFHGSISPSIREFSLETPNNASLTNTLDKRIYFSDSKGIAALYAVDPEYKLALTIDHLADAVGLDREGLEIIASQLKMPIKDVKKIVKDYEIGLNFVVRKTNQEDFIYPAYLNIRKHADIDLNGDIISRLSKEARAEVNANPGAIIRNVNETVSNLYGIRTAPSTDYLVQYPLQIKRSAAITYDTNGNIIPISQRDNFHNPDINYKVGGKLIPKNSKGGPTKILKELGEDILTSLDKEDGDMIAKFLEIPILSETELAKRSENNLKAIDIYRSRLNNGGVKKVKEQGTARYNPSDIRVFLNYDDLRNKIKEIDLIDNPVPTDLFKDLQEVLIKLRNSFQVGNITDAEVAEAVSNLLQDEYPDKIKRCIQYVTKEESPKVKRYKEALLSAESKEGESGFARQDGNFVWAPNEQTIKDIYWRPSDKLLHEMDIKYWQTTLPHEFEHAFLDGDIIYSKYFKPKNAIPVEALLHERFTPEQLKKMQEEMALIIGIKPDSVYLTSPTELLARGTQIKNWLGITDPNYKLTALDLKEAAAYYTKSGPNNNMKEFFKSIVDWEKAAKFLSKATIITGAVAGVGTTAAVLAALNDQAQFSKRGGNLKLIPKNDSRNKIFEVAENQKNLEFRCS